MNSLQVPIDYASTSLSYFNNRYHPISSTLKNEITQIFNKKKKHRKTRKGEKRRAKSFDFSYKHCNKCIQYGPSLNLIKHKYQCRLCGSTNFKKSYLSNTNNLRLYEELIVNHCCISTVNHSEWTPCISPKLINFHEQSSDTSLGPYLFDLFKYESCPNMKCNQHLTNHILTYSYYNKQIVIKFNHLNNDDHKHQNNETILIWSKCKKCKLNKTNPKPMSDRLFCLSFGKFLEILFYSYPLISIASNCNKHNLSDDHMLYFSFNNKMIEIDLIENNRYKLLSTQNIIKMAQIFDGALNRNGSKEPSSIISYTLSSLQNHCKLHNIRYDSVFNTKELNQKLNRTLNNKPRETENESNDSNTTYLNDEYIAKLTANIDSNWNDEIIPFIHPSFTCNIYYAVHFNALRKGLYDNMDIERDFIYSLSQCNPCDLSGGKKGTFCKTLNDKYLLKFIKENEFKMFLNNFQSYFDYIINTIYNKIASLLVPIIGCYEINWTKSTKKKLGSTQYVLIMPNLFHLHDIDKLKRFDLKGTINNKRYIDDAENVKLDKNFIEYMKGLPLHLDKKSINYLNDAIDNDTDFLFKSNIMDYSLLIGINNEKNEIIGGIIDYLETYSWKKKAEKTIKSLFIDDSTIQNANIYKNRFKESIKRKYFIS